MNRDPIIKGEYLHIYNRGHRKSDIFREARDWWRFLEMLYYFNDEYEPINLLSLVHKSQESNKLKPLSRMEDWPARKPLIKIMAFALMKNHYHILAKEIRKGGTSKFMLKLGTGMANYFNIKYGEAGSLFQGPYKYKKVEEEMYLRDLSAYIQVKNPFERYPGGLRKAVREFDKAYDWVIKDPYNSLADYAGKRSSPIIDKDILTDFSGVEYKSFAKDSMLARRLEGEVFAEYAFEEL